MKLWIVVLIAAVAGSVVSCQSGGKPAGGKPAGGMPAESSVAVLPANESPAAMMMTVSDPVETPTTRPATTAPVTIVATTQPLVGPLLAGATTQKADDLADAFVDPVNGIEFNPPKNGVIRRVLDSGEIVGFSYPDRGWDIRVKPVPLRQPLPLSDKKSSGLMELTASQLVAQDDSAEILTQRVFAFGTTPAGLIEARYSKGIDRVFAQEVLLPQGLKNYLMIQMVSPGGATGEGKLKESEARRVFQEVIGTFKLLDREDLRKKQEEWILNGERFLQGVNEDQIRKVLVPQRYFRVEQKFREQNASGVQADVTHDIGFMCIFERPVTRDGQTGIQIVVRSHMVVFVAPAATPPKSDATATANTGAQDNDQQIQLRSAVGPALAGGTHADAMRTDSYNEYWMTYDQKHETWMVSILVRDGSQPATESGNTDVTIRRVLDREKQKTLAPNRNSDGQPPILEIPERKLSVTPAHGKSIDTKVPTYFYLPQAMEQLLPRLLPTEPRNYVFGSYVSETRAVMMRYVEVGQAEDVVLDHTLQKAIPVRDRIGVEGIPTTIYVTPDGKWVGSINSQTGLEVLPTTVPELKDVWTGFVEYPAPALPQNTPKSTKITIPPTRNPVLQDQ